MISPLKSEAASWKAGLGGLQNLSVDALQWMLGLFCGFIGAFMLVAPHQFDRLPYVVLSPYLNWWGLAALIGGAALLSVPVTRPGVRATAGFHAAAGAILLALGGAFASNSAWTGAILYGTLGLGTAVAGWLPGARDPRPIESGDLLTLLLALGALAASVVMLLNPAVFRSPFYPSGAGALPLLAVAWLVLMPLLAAVQLLRGCPRTLVLAAHLLGGGVLIAFGVVASWPTRLWTGLALYCGGGLVVAVLPWLRRRLVGADPSALRTRLALALALATSVALILAVAVVAEQEERLAARQVVALQRMEALSVAQNVVDYLDFNAARSAAVAAMAGRRPMIPEDQGSFLDGTRRIQPDVVSFTVLDLQGGVIAGSGSPHLDARTARGLARALRGSRLAYLVLLPGEGGRRLLLLGSPIPGLDNRPIGALATVLDADSFRRRISRPGSRVTIADGRGNVIASLDKTQDRLPAGSTRPFGASPATSAVPAAPATPAIQTAGGTSPAGALPPSGSSLPSGWDREVAAGRPPPKTEGLAAFAPMHGTGWVVAVERPRAAALAGVRRGRDFGFVLLLGVVALAVVAGTVTARRIARPLDTLANAVDAMTAGDPAAPLAESSVTEVARLSAAFAEMRSRLERRTVESERLASESQARAAALAEADRRKDEFLAMLAHELRNPLGAIANASYVLEQLSSEEPRAERAIEVIGRQTQHLVRLVDDLLDVSRITRGKVVLKREPVDLVEVVRHAVETSLPLAEARGHRIALSLPAKPLAIEADPTRIEQVLSNLIRNAVKFTEPGGRIEVTAAGDDVEATVRVKDSGVGIAPELLPRVFDLFVQGEQGLDRSAAGLGIGLTMVRRLIEMHHGRVEVQSEGLGRGAEFIVHLPLHAWLDETLSRV